MSYLRESWLRPLVLSGDMLRNWGLVLLTIFDFFNQISPEQIIYNDGWIPMSHNDIYDQIRRESTEYPVYLTMKPPMDYENTMNLVERKINDKKDFRDFKGNLEQFNEKPRNIDKFLDRTDKSDQLPVNSQGNSRKAKRVWDHALDISVDNILARPEIDSNKTSKVNEENITNDVIAAAETSNTYEVTEDIDTIMTTEDDNVNEYVGYQYNPPTDENQNLTSTFYKILSKYNIKTDDKLQNYDLSLQHKVENPSTSVHQVPLPYKYNSLNHLPVDPLLAVFLSNYGFYLPSLYGIKANYNNLYGYLASNNIHNNKPFGLYKIFSDTDSSN